MGDIFRSLRAERDRYKMLLEQDETEMLLYDGQGRLIFSTLRNMNSDYAQSFAQRALRGHYGTNRVTQKTYDNMRITVGQKEWTAEGETYRAFFFRQSALPYSTQKNDARIFSRASASRKFLGGRQCIVVSLGRKVEWIPNGWQEEARRSFWWERRA